MNCKVKVEIKYEGKRKDLVKDIAAAIGATPKYLAAPTFAYQVGIYTINRDDTMEWNTEDMTMEVGTAMRPLKDNGRIVYGQIWMDGELVVADNSEYEETPDEPNVAPHAGETEPEGTTTPEPQEEALKDRIIQFYQQLDGSALTVLNADQMEIGIPNNLTDTEITNLQDLMVQKMEILDQAFPGKIVMNVTPDRIEFPWFPAGEDATPYIMFITRFVEMARMAKRISKKAQKITNPKYQFRCFLLRLGFIGKEYGPARKVLLSRLEGNSAWLRGSREA